VIEKKRDIQKYAKLLFFGLKVTRVSALEDI